MLAPDSCQQLFWAALETGDLEVLQKLSDKDIDWNQINDSTATSPLLYAFLSMIKDFDIKYGDMIEWLVRQGADPTRRFPVDWPDVKLNDSRNISLKGKSVLELMHQFLNTIKAARHREAEGCRVKSLFVDFLCELIHRITLAYLESMSSQRDQVRVDQSVVDLWERVLSSTSSHDVAFQTADKPVTAHSLLLSEASPVLKAMLSSAMREGETRQIPVKDTSSTAVQLFLETLYTCSSRSEPTCIDVLGALDLAHRWQVSGVVTILAEALEAMISENDFVVIAEAAVLRDLTKLKEACRSFLGKAPKAVQTGIKEKLCRQAALDLFPTAQQISTQSEKRRRRF